MAANLVYSKQELLQLDSCVHFGTSADRSTYFRSISNPYSSYTFNPLRNGRKRKRGKKGGSRQRQKLSRNCINQIEDSNDTLLRTMIVNFRSLVPKRTEMWQTIQDMKPDIILGTETWLTPDVKDAEIFPPEIGYTVFRKDRDDGYGGVLVAVKHGLTAHEINKQTRVEAVLVKIKLNSVALTVGSVYRTPSQSTKDQMDEITQFLDGLDTNDVLWIGGDFNLPDIDWNHERVIGRQYPASMNNTFIEKMRDLGLSQVVHTATRNNNTLDLFLTNRPNLITKCETTPGLSDHDIVIVDSNLKANKISQSPYVVTIWKKANIAAIKEETHNFSNDLLNLTNPNVENMWTSINNHLKSMMKKHIPTKLCSKKFHQPWINTKLKRLSRQKQRAWAKAKASNLPAHWEKYKTLKKETRCENRRAYQTHVKKLVEEDSNKDLWKFIKSRKCDPVGVAPLNKGDTLHTNNKDKANVLNDQFCSIFVSEIHTNIPPLVETKHPIMSDIIVTKDGVEKLLSSLNPKKSSRARWYLVTSASANSQRDRSGPHQAIPSISRHRGNSNHLETCYCPTNFQEGRQKCSI